MKESIIRINNLKIFAYHGVHDYEKEKGNNFEVDVDLYCNVEIAKTTDNINETINYEEVYYLIVNEIETTRHNLVESLAYSVIKKLFDKFNKIHKIKIKLRKLNPPTMTNIDSVEIELVEERIR